MKKLIVGAMVLGLCGAPTLSAGLYDGTGEKLETEQPGKPWRDIATMFKEITLCHLDTESDEDPMFNLFSIFNGLGQLEQQGRNIGQRKDAVLDHFLGGNRVFMRNKAAVKCFIEIEVATWAPIHENILFYLSKNGYDFTHETFIR